METELREKKRKRGPDHSKEKEPEKVVTTRRTKRERPDDFVVNELRRRKPHVQSIY